MFRDLVIYTPMYVTFFWSIVLLFSNINNNKAKRFLGVFMFTAFLLYLSHALFFKQNEKGYLVFDSIYIFCSLSVYPLYYWYIKLLTIETKYNLKNLILLAPAIILSIVSAAIYITMRSEERLDYLYGFLMERNPEFQNTLNIRLQKAVFYITRAIFAIQVIYFLIRGRRLVSTYNNRIANFYSNLESRTIVWVNLLLYSFVLTSIASVIFNIIGRDIFLNSTYLLVIPSFIFSVLLFFIGFQGYMQNHTVEDLLEDEKQQSTEKIKEYNQKQLKQKLEHLFITGKIYRNPDLKITQVSEKLQTNRTYVSNLINTEFSCSFNDFVNKHRIEEAKSMIENDILKDYSLNYISEAVGFGSLNTFIRVFKEIEGMTPGNFRNRFQMNQY